jgi:hypothetical protein
LCHGSKYLLDGTRVEGPATRDLDRLVVRAINAHGDVLSETRRGDADHDPAAGQPIPIPASVALLEIDTNKRIRGRRNAGKNMVE